MSHTHRQIVWLVLAFPFASCTATGSATGTLEGHVTIGPLVPVVRVDEPPPTPTPEMYAAYKIVVSTSGGSLEVARVPVSAQGNYSVHLPAGTYRVTVSRNGNSFGASRPATITILPGITTRQDLEVDTGIR